MNRVVVGFLAVILARAQPEGARPSDLATLERSLEAAVQQRPAAAAWEKLGLVRHLQNRFEDAIPAFREAVRLNPSLWTSHLFLGVCLYRTNRFPLALASLETAAALARGNPPGRDDVDYWLAATHVALKKPLDALAPLERLLGRNPKHLDALELAVRTYSDLSTAAWNDVAERHFDTSAGQEVHGHALDSEGNRPGALEAFRRARQLDPSRAGPGLAIGRLLLQDAKPGEARKELEREVRLPRADPEAAYYLGLACMENADYAEAAKWLERAAPWHAGAPLALAQAYLAGNDVAKAAAAARQAAAADPASADAHRLLLMLLEKSGQTAEAAAERARWERRRSP